MEYKYKIYKLIYDSIISREKNIEFRLLNEKSKKIKQGDIIKFEIVDNENNYVLAEVIDKYIYNNLEELWNSKEVLSNALDYTKEEFIKEFNEIFGAENVKRSKIIGIKFKVKERL